MPPSISSCKALVYKDLDSIVIFPCDPLVITSIDISPDAKHVVLVQRKVQGWFLAKHYTIEITILTLDTDNWKIAKRSSFKVPCTFPLLHKGAFQHVFFGGEGENSNMIDIHIQMGSYTTVFDISSGKFSDKTNSGLWVRRCEEFNNSPSNPEHENPVLIKHVRDFSKSVRDGGDSGEYINTPICSYTKGTLTNQVHIIDRKSKEIFLKVIHEKDPVIISSDIINIGDNKKYIFTTSKSYAKLTKLPHSNPKQN